MIKLKTEPTMSYRVGVVPILAVLGLAAFVLWLIFGQGDDHEYQRGYADGYVLGESVHSSILDDDGPKNLKGVPVNRSDNPPEMALFRGGKGEYWWASSLRESGPAGPDTLYVRWQK